MPQNLWLNTAEGGGCITTDPELSERLKRIRFFGHDEQKDVIEDGFNGKMTEVHAALGLANLKYFDRVLMDRKRKIFITRIVFNILTLSVCRQSMRENPTIPIFRSS